MVFDLLPFTVVRNDITKERTHAVVNAANSQLEHGAGVRTFWLGIELLPSLLVPLFISLTVNIFAQNFTTH